MSGPRQLREIVSAVVAEVLARVAERSAGALGRLDELGGRHVAEAGTVPAPCGVPPVTTAAAARQTPRRRDFRRSG